MKKPLLFLTLATIPLHAHAQATAPDATTPAAPATPATNPAPATTSPTPATSATNPPPVENAEKIREATIAYNTGLAALKKGNWDIAGQYFGKAAALTPNDAGALSFLGYVRLQQHRWDDALVALQSARDTGKDLDTKAQSQLWNNIGFALWNKDNFPEARSAFEKALALDKNYYDARYNLAFAFLSRERWTDALPHLRLLATANPNDAAVQDGIGEALERTGNISGALGAYKKASDLAPRNENYRFKFALALVQSDRRDEALVQLRQVLAINPANAPALLQVGDLHLKSNRWDQAAGALKRYVALRSNDFTGRFNLGVALDYSARFDEALEQYAKAEALKPDDAPTKNNVGRIYYKREKYEEAVAKFNEALKLDPNFSDARTNLAIVLAAQGKYDDSNAQWKQLISQAEDQSRGETNLNKKKGWLARITTARAGMASNYLAQNHYADAAGEYRRLLQISPNDLDAWSGLGRSLYQIATYPEAEAAYRSIIKIDPKNANAFNDLGVVLEAEKKRNDAIDAYKQALDIKPDHTEAKSNLERLTGKGQIG